MIFFLTIILEEKCKAQTKVTKCFRRLSNKKNHQNTHQEHGTQQSGSAKCKYQDFKKETLIFHSFCRQTVKIDTTQVNERVLDSVQRLGFISPLIGSSETKQHWISRWMRTMSRSFSWRELSSGRTGFLGGLISLNVLTAGEQMLLIMSVNEGTAWTTLGNTEAAEWNTAILCFYTFLPRLVKIWKT